MRQRNFLVRHRSEALAHVKLTNHQYNLAAFEKHIGKKGNHADLAERLKDPAERKKVEVELMVADHSHLIIDQLEAYLVRRIF